MKSTIWFFYQIKKRMIKMHFRLTWIMKIEISVILKDVDSMKNSNYDFFNKKNRELDKYEQNLEKIKNKKEVNLAQIKVKEMKKRNYEKIMNKINEMESFLYKNYIKDYEIAFEKEVEKMKLIEKKKKIFFEETKKRANEFTKMLIGILEKAAEKERTFIKGEKYRKEMDLEKRTKNKKKVYNWLRKMSENPEFGEENSQMVRNWLIVHKTIFGEEFEERYDPYLIIIKIANIDN